VSNPLNERTFTTESLTRNLPLETVRLCYAESIRIATALRSQALAEAFATVPREHYLGPGPWKFAVGPFQSPISRGYITTPDADPRNLYHDVLVAIDPTRQLNNGHPSTLATFLDFLELQRAERVLHVGCGLGYYTAIIAHVVGSGGHVTAVEIDPELALRAQTNLAHLENVTVCAGDGVTYDPGQVDVIFVNAGVTHPQSLWLDRLNENGRLLVPITFTPPSAAGSGQAIGHGNMLLVLRAAEKYEASFVSPVSIYSSPSGRDANYNQAISQGYREMMMGKQPRVKRVRRDSHPSDATCWLHSEDCCLSTAD
jgi:protein-L-isoaspartate(D-aspartate) O-methyltransferase